MTEQLSPLDPDPARRTEAYAALRAQCPVHQVGPGRFMAVDHNTVQTGLRSVTDFGGSAGQYGLPEEDTSVAGLPEPRHGWVRRIINSVVAFHKSQQIEPYLADLCNRLAQDTVAAEGAESMQGIDIMPLFVDPLPPAAMPPRIPSRGLVALLPVGCPTGHSVRRGRCRWTVDLHARGLPGNGRVRRRADCRTSPPPH